jgi:hypothetical protein
MIPQCLIKLLCGNKPINIKKELNLQFILLAVQWGRSGKSESFLVRGKYANKG